MLFGVMGIVNHPVNARMRYFFAGPKYISHIGHSFLLELGGYNTIKYRARQGLSPSGRK